MLTRLIYASIISAGCVSHPSRQTTRSVLTEGDEVRETVVYAFSADLAGARAANAEVTLRVERDAALGNETVLVVDYPPPGNNPAARDVYLEAENKNWTGARAIAFRIKPAHAMRLSVSFMDRNHIAYTAWRDLQGGIWQPVRIAFDSVRPNPFFQPPDAKTGAPIDVSEVNGIGFSPQDRAAGQLAISRVAVVR